MIELSDDLIFAQGGRRFCFVHPDDPMKCIKTLSPRGNPEKRRNEAAWYKKMRPLSSFDDNLDELKSFQQLEKKGDEVWDHFPRCYGMESTNRGAGIVTDLIRDADGQVSITVKTYLKTIGKTPELLAALDEFFSMFWRQVIVTRDILQHNLVVQMGADKMTIYIIDGFDSSEVIPISLFCKTLGRKHVLRKVARCKKRYGLAE